MRLIPLFLALCFISPLHAYNAKFKKKSSNSKSVQNKHAPELTHEESRTFFNQWFTGPLLMPSPVTLPPAHPCFEPSVQVLDTYGNYQSNWKIDRSAPRIWSVVYGAYYQQGFSKHFGAEVVGAFRSNYSKNGTANYFTDTIARFGYQVSYDKHEKGNWIPDFRIIFQETFPTGKYQKLNPNKPVEDTTGAGAFYSGIYLAAQKGFAWPSNHAFHLCSSVGFFLPSSFKVTGYNVYGGDHFTSGRVYPGAELSVYFSGEFEITRHIALAFDSNYQQNFSGRFSGDPGGSGKIDVPQQVTFFLAPELEIIVSQKAGFLIGTWFTFSGQNTPAYVSFFADLMYTF